MNALDQMTWLAAAIVLVIVGAAVGSLVYPWIKYGVQQWMAHWQRETDKLGEMHHEGVEVPDIYEHLRCDICGELHESDHLGKLVWQKHGPFGTVVQEGTIIACDSAECRTQAKMLQLHKSGILADPPPRPQTASEWINDDASWRRAKKKFKERGRPFGDLR